MNSVISSLDKGMVLAYNGKLGEACKSRIVVGVAPVMSPHVYEVQNWAELKALACAGNAKITVHRAAARLAKALASYRHMEAAVSEGCAS